MKAESLADALVRAHAAGDRTALHALADLATDSGRGDLYRLESGLALRRQVTVRPAYDRRRGLGGVGSATLHFVLLGPRGAAEFSCFTGWALPGAGALTSEGVGVTLHSVRAAEGFEPSEGCLVLGGVCWSDTSYLAGPELFALLVRGGHEPLWAELAGWYDRLPEGI